MTAFTTHLLAFAIGGIVALVVMAAAELHDRRRERPRARQRGDRGRMAKR